MCTCHSNLNAPAASYPPQNSTIPYHTSCYAARLDLAGSCTHLHTTRKHMLPCTDEMKRLRCNLRNADLGVRHIWQRFSTSFVESWRVGVRATRGYQFYNYKTTKWQNADGWYVRGQHAINCKTIALSLTHTYTSQEVMKPNIYIYTYTYGTRV